MPQCSYVPPAHVVETDVYGLYEEDESVGAAVDAAVTAAAAAADLEEAAAEAEPAPRGRTNAKFKARRLAAPHLARRVVGLLRYDLRQLQVPATEIRRRLHLTDAELIAVVEASDGRLTLDDREMISVTAKSRR